MTLAPGRREANKTRTRAALLDAVYRLAETADAGSLTAERIADAAGISRRTFFNYFESVDALLASGAEDILDSVWRMLSARPADEHPLDAAYAVVEELFTVEFLDHATRTWRVVERYPGARRFALEFLADHSERMARDLGRRHPEALPEDDPLVAAVLTTTLLSAFDEARRHWLIHHEGSIDRDAVAGLLARVRHAFDVVRPAFARL